MQVTLTLLMRVCKVACVNVLLTKQGCSLRDVQHRDSVSSVSPSFCLL